MVRLSMLLLVSLSVLATGCRWASADEGELYACEAEGGCHGPEDVCTAQGVCVPRAWAPRLVSPEKDGSVGSRVRVEVFLEPDRGEPAALSLRVVKQGDGGAHPTDTVPLERVAADTFTAVWEPTRGVGEYELTAWDEDLGLASPPVQVRVDATTPGFRVEVVGSGQARKWRRDQRVEVWVTSESPDVDANSVRLEAHGVHAGSDAGVALALEPCDGGPAARYCGRSELVLSRPALAALEGTFTLRATGANAVGNTGSATKDLQVTRLKWQWEADSPLLGPPVLDTEGTLYVDIGGRVMMLRPDGTVKGSTDVFVLGGQQGLAMGPVSAKGTKVLCLLERATPEHPARLVALDVERGALLGSCPVSEPAFVHGESLVLGDGPPTQEGSASEVALAAFHDGQGRVEHVALHLVGGALRNCLHARSTLPSPVRLFAQGARFYADSKGKLEEVLMQDTCLIAQPLKADCICSEVDLMVGSSLIGIEPEASFVYDTTTARCDAFNVGGTRFDKVASGVRSDAQKRLVFMKQRAGDTGLLLFRGAINGSNITERPAPAGVPQGLVLGAEGQLHGVMNPGSKLQVWRREELEEAWRWEVPFGGEEGLGSTLDCSRDAKGRPIQGGMGVWYVVEGRRLSAILVGSPGIDAEAHWPGARHDPQGTGNTATSLQPFRCPSPPRLPGEAPPR